MPNEFITPIGGFTKQVSGLGLLVSKWTPFMQKGLKGVGLAVAPALAWIFGLVGVKWAIGDVAFYVGLGFLTLLVFFAIYLYLR